MSMAMIPDLFDLQKWVWIAGNGDLRMVPNCNVKLSVRKGCVAFDEQNEEEEEYTEERMRMQSMIKKLKEKENRIGIFWLKLENTKSFEDVAFYTVEIPTKEQNTPEVREAKMKEVENLMRYEVFEEVEVYGQERIGSRWVRTQN